MSQFVLTTPSPRPLEPISSKLHGGSIHQQNQSPLFSTLPPEVRNRIFMFALKAYDDVTKPYHPQDWVYRPGFHFHAKYSVELLQTCKRIYLEARLLPFALNAFTFWGGEAQAPSDTYYQSRKAKDINDNDKRTQRLSLSSFSNGRKPPWEDFRAGFFDKLTADQRNAVGELHFVTQQFYLESVLRLSPPLDRAAHAPVTARRLKLTLRNHDWWGWQHERTLCMCPWVRGRTPWTAMLAPPAMPTDRLAFLAAQGWGAQLDYVHGLQEFELEMETLLENRARLDLLVQRAKTWVFPLRRGRFLRWHEGAGVKETRWEQDDLPLRRYDLPASTWPPGPDVADLPPHMRPVDLAGWPRCRYIVASMTWRVSKE